MSTTTNKEGGGGVWALIAQDGRPESLQYDPAVIGGTEKDLGPHDVLVELRAASLNYRDLVIVKPQIAVTQGILPNLVPGSDGAGIILAVGSSVDASFRPGQPVITHLAPTVEGTDTLPGFEHITDGMGQKIHGTLRRRGVFPASGLVALPAEYVAEGEGQGVLTYVQASTLTCSGITAWNALMGVPGKQVKAGDWVVTQGTGGVSVAALQFAVAAGAHVIATTSSESKAEKLRKLGAEHVINYKTTPQWGEKAKELTPGGEGVDHVVDVAGVSTLSESVKAVKADGLVTLAGFLGGLEGQEMPSLMAPLWHRCIVRGVLLGTRSMMRDMIKFVGEKKVDLAVDDVQFSLEDAKAAYERLEKQQHFAKVVIAM